MHLPKSQISVVCLLLVVALSLPQGHGMPAGSPHGTATHLSERQIPGVSQKYTMLWDYIHNINYDCTTVFTTINFVVFIFVLHMQVPQPLQIISDYTNKLVAVEDNGDIHAMSASEKLIV